MVYDYGNEAELTAEDVRETSDIVVKNGSEVERRAGISAYDEKLLIRDQIY
jgi:hypothetical protein